MSLQPAQRCFLDHLATTGDIVEAAKNARMTRADLCRAFTDETFRAEWQIAKQYIGKLLQQEIAAPGEPDDRDADPISAAEASPPTAAADRVSAVPATRRNRPSSHQIDRGRARRQMLLARRVHPDQAYKRPVVKGDGTTLANAGPTTRANLVGRASARRFQEQTHDP